MPGEKSIFIQPPPICADTGEFDLDCSAFSGANPRRVFLPPYF
jgi:hypothetical protein